MIIHDVEQNSDAWFILRSGIPTGSRASSLVTPTGKASTGIEAYAVELANEKHLGEQHKTFTGNKHTERGHELEPIAADDYEFTHACELKKVGFCTDDEERYGVSPDRVISDKAGVEIKCLDNQAHTSALVHYHKTRKPPPDRIAQLQMQLFVMEWEYVDLFYYHDKLPAFTIRVLPQKTYIEMIECQLEEVIERRDEIIKILEEYNA